MTRSSTLGGSWTAADDEKSGSEWSGDEDLSLSGSDLLEQTPPNLQRDRRTSGRRSFRPIEPEFIMPSIESLHPSPQRPSPRQSPRNAEFRKRATPMTASQPVTRTSRERPQDSTLKSESTSAVDYAFSYVGAVLVYFLDVVLSALKLLKKPISVLVAAYFFLGFLTLLGNFLTNSIYDALTPICHVPFAATLLPICSYHSSRTGRDGSSGPTIDASSSAPDPEFSSLMSAQSQLSGILDDTTASLSLPLSMKRSEVSIRDLRQVVRFSSLSSRHELVLEFDGFIESARAASFDLQKFNSHVGRAVDITLSTARWTERILDDMSYTTNSASNSLVPGFIRSLMSPFAPVTFTKARVLDQYLIHTSVISDEIAKLIDEAQALLMLLQGLEDRLEVIHSISFSSSQTAQISKDEILTHLWTMLGGNRAQVSKYNHHLGLLRQVGQYRTAAFAHVSGTILKLQAMGAELEELRTRVDAAGLEREVRKEVPLEVHIESIRLGVERLEEGRAKAREVERGYVKRVIDVSETGELGVDEKRLGLDG